MKAVREFLDLIHRRATIDRFDPEHVLAREKTLDAFIEGMTKIREEATNTPEVVKGATHIWPVRRLDDVRAARELDLRWRQAAD